MLPSSGEAVISLHAISTYRLRTFIKSTDAFNKKEKTNKTCHLMETYKGLKIILKISSSPEPNSQPNLVQR